MEKQKRYREIFGQRLKKVVGNFKKMSIFLQEIKNFFVSLQL